MATIKSYHNSIKNERHIFLFAVLGRSSSTAFQRIINSSNEVWMWGEPRHLINKMGLVFRALKEMRDDKYVISSVKHMYKSYHENKHLSFYGSSLGNLDSTREIAAASISNLLTMGTRVETFRVQGCSRNTIRNYRNFKRNLSGVFFVVLL